MIILRMLSRRWILTTVLVICATGVLVRLGIWQLDRLESRRSFNARVQIQVEAAPLDLDQEGVEPDLAEMEYRKVKVSGTYDHSKQIALRNQYWGNQWGVHLVTPLQLSGSDQIILVDRGWIPAEEYQSGDWSEFDEPGVVTVAGILRRSQEKADFGSRSDPPVQAEDFPMTAWNFVNIERLSVVMSSSLLRAYIQQAPEPSWTSLPYRYQPTLDLTEGPHFGYALQWFTFAAILGIGYPFFIQRQERRRHVMAEKLTENGPPSPILHSNES
ncbi:MAG: hypothetical protein A2Z16_17210 [Chloroflexi bacterium RBG_16_54_18]|nr:MAG: hypothetical protein A2Z16_17210 [Chloroflexi bacterium RBG_16_54_18]